MTAIYKITSPEGHVYVGQTRCFIKRYSQHKSKHGTQSYLHKSFRKHGFESHKFEIIHELPKDTTQDVLDNYECFCIEQYKECGIVMLNSREGGKNGKPSKEHIGQMVATRKRLGNYIPTESQRLARSIRLKGVYPKGITREHVLKGAKKRIGTKLSEGVKAKISESQKGRQHSDETKQSLSDSAYKRWSEERFALSTKTGIFYDRLKDLWAAEYSNYTYKCFWSYYETRGLCVFL